MDSFPLVIMQVCPPPKRDFSTIWRSHAYEKSAPDQVSRRRTRANAYKLQHVCHVIVNQFCYLHTLKIVSSSFNYRGTISFLIGKNTLKLKLKINHRADLVQWVWLNICFSLSEKAKPENYNMKGDQSLCLVQAWNIFRASRFILFFHIFV